MEVSVWDTYVTREDGRKMHFDILVPSELKDEKVIFSYGKAFLKSKSFETGELTLTECRYCHMEQLTPAVAQQIEKHGYSILEMENCS